MDKPDPKFQEYLGLAKASAPRKTWQVDDVAAVSEAKVENAQNDAQKAEDVPIPSKKRSKQTSTTLASVQQHGADVEQNRSPVGATAPDTEQAAEARGKEGIVAVNDAEGTRSDAEWMRSRTSRLLGLADDEDEEEEEVGNKTHQDAPSPDSEPSSGEENPTVHAAEDVTEHVSQDKAESDADAETIRKCGRLFLRNLSYIITEADLQSLFSPYGSLDEVSLT